MSGLVNIFIVNRWHLYFI